jgi:ABC-2 type transport system ATP-binding protein
MEEFAIKVENASKVFKLPHEKHASLKSVFVNIFKKNRKGYELQKALNGVSLEIEKGDFFGIVGRNGSGKSTLLKLLAGIYSPTTGQVHVRGSLTPFIELGVGFNPELTGRENVFLNGALLGFNRSEMRKMYNDIVEFAEIEKFMDQKLKNYSSGMQVRLAFSIAIRAQSDILLIDEVLAVGDAAFQRKCFDYFEELKKVHRTVVLVSHDMEAVKRFCNRAALISKGKVTFIGAPEHAAELYAKQNASDIKLSEIPTEIDAGAQITELKIVGNHKNGFERKDKLTVRFTVNAQVSLNAVLGINILKDNGQLIAATSSDSQLKARRLDPKKKVVYEFVLPSNQFALGSYLIDGIIYDFDTKEQIFFKHAMDSFKIVDDVYRGWGAFNVSGTWEEVTPD